MPHPDHNAIVAAFATVDPTCRAGCHRGDPARGYTHIHGPSQASHPDRCSTHSVIVEKFNGTVSVRRPIGATLGGTRRTAIPIAQDPMGYSVGPEFGDFDIGFTVVTILARWATFDNFARAVIASARASHVW